MQFLEKQAGILVDILNQLINEDDDKDHSGSPRDLQDEGVPVDNTNVNVDLEAGDDQPQDATTGSQDDNTFELDLDTNQLFSPPPEPGPSRACQVFEVGPDSEPDEGEGEEEPERGEPTYVWFWPDVLSEGEHDGNDDEVSGTPLEDPRLARGEDARQLDIERDLDDLGTYKIFLNLIWGQLR